MKAERGEGRFIPIVITLETEEEAKLLWNLLDSWQSDLVKLLGYAIPDNLDGDMFGALDSVYNP